tara:strand:+ start:519 stop:944 length:426 start_codon:yes stop_codon:yes gene_type:complete
MIAQNYAVKSNSQVVPTRSMIFGNETYEVIGTGLNGLMHDPRKADLNDRWGFGMLNMFDLADQNKPCVTIDNVGAMIRVKNVNPDVIDDELGMTVKPNPASRLNIIGLAHTPCDIASINQPILRGSNNFNHQLAPPFKPHF